MPYDDFAYSGGISLDKSHELRKISNQKNNVNMPTEQGGFSQPSQDPTQDVNQLKKERFLTFGEKAVGLSFNPSNNEKVEKIKRAYADVIDLLADYRAGNPNDEKNTDIARMLSIAITESQTAQMWAVKAVTWQY